jgi:Flp pilus assembly protein TadB
VAALAGVALVGHGGVGGALVEALLVVVLLALFLAVYLRERRARRDDDPS